MYLCTVIFLRVLFYCLLEICCNNISLSHDTQKIPFKAFSLSISYSYCVCLTEYVSMNKQWCVDFQGVCLPVIYLQFLLFDQIQKLQRQEPPGLFRSRFFAIPFYFFIYSLIFNLQGEEDKMVAGGDENKSHPSLFIRHEKDTQ